MFCAFSLRVGRDVGGKQQKDSHRYRVDQKKVNLVLDQLEKCGFLHGVQDVSNNTFIVILDIAKF